MNARFFMILAAVVTILVFNYTFVFCSPTKIVNEILKMHESGLGEETILMYFQSRDAVFELTSEDLITLRKAGFSEEFIQALLKFRKTPVYEPPQWMNDYGASYFSYSVGLNYGCFSFNINPFACNSSPCNIRQFNKPPAHLGIDPKRYFYSAGHAYVRHNGHFHKDDQHRFQTVANLNQLPENAFISQRPAKINLTHGSFKIVSVANRWSGKSSINERSLLANSTRNKSNRSAGSFHGLRSNKPSNRIGFGSSRSKSAGTGFKQK